jgi:limonene-1,2-epoxide hydrolase
MPATGRSGRVKACQVFEVHYGRVTATRHYFNLMTIMKQLGVTPGAEVHAAQ